MTNIGTAFAVAFAGNLLLIGHIGWFRSSIISVLLGTLAVLYIEDRRETAAQRRKR